MFLGENYTNIPGTEFSRKSLLRLTFVDLNWNKGVIDTWHNEKLFDPVWNNVNLGLSSFLWCNPIVSMTPNASSASYSFHIE